MENDELGSLAPDTGDLALLNEGADETNEETNEETTDETSEDTGEVGDTSDEVVDENNNEEEVTEDEGKTEETSEEDKEAAPEGTDKNPSFERISKVYPDFFKKFPEVRTALAKELQYKNLYPTIADAKESKERLDFHAEMESSILEGDPSTLLSRLHQTDEGALKKFTKNFLPTLARGNPALYQDIAVPLVNNVLRSALKDAERTNSKNLKEAVRWVSNFLNDSPDLPENVKEDEGKNSKTEPSEAETKLHRMQMQNIRNFQSELSESTYSVLTSTIKSTIDPKNQIPSVLKDALVNKILADVKEDMENDKEHLSSMKRLWIQAAQNDYSRQNLSQLKSAFLARAKKILPVIQKKHVNETLKEMGLRKAEVLDNKTRKIGPTVKRGQFTKGIGKDPRRLDPSKTDAQLLAED